MEIAIKALERNKFYLKTHGPQVRRFKISSWKLHWIAKTRSVNIIVTFHIDEHCNMTNGAAAKVIVLDRGIITWQVKPVLERRPLNCCKRILAPCNTNSISIQIFLKLLFKFSSDLDDVPAVKGSDTFRENITFNAENNWTSGYLEAHTTAKFNNVHWKKISLFGHVDPASTCNFNAIELVYVLWNIVVFY